MYLVSNSVSVLMSPSHFKVVIQNA